MGESAGGGATVFAGVDGDDPRSGGAGAAGGAGVRAGVADATLMALGTEAKATPPRAT